MIPNTQKRSSSKEILDDPLVSCTEIRKSLNFIVNINRYLGGTRVILKYFQNHSTPESFTVLDLGAGAGDIDFAVAEWAKRNSKRAVITAIDVNDYCIQYAKEKFYHIDITYLKHSAFEFQTLGSFDYIMSSMFFHHLSDDEIIALLGFIKTHCRYGYCVNDLYRSKFAYLGAKILGLLSGDHIVVNDAPLSVLRGFKENDLERYTDRLGFGDVRIERLPFFRISMSSHA